MNGQFQFTAYPLSESRLAARNGNISGFACADAALHGGVAAVAIPSPTLFDDCPLCGKAPIEPVRVEGQLVCRGCTGACVVCSAACIPGDDACGECVRCLRVQVVLA